MRPIDPTSLRASMARRLLRRSVVTGEITIPAVPSMIDEYVTMCATVFAAVGCPFSPDEGAHLRTVLQDQLARAFAQSPRSSLVISYKAPVGTILNYEINPRWWTLEEEYANWLETREPPLFGTEPDARVWALANQAADPRTHRVLDVGAGTGRNALALARRGHPVDVVELTPQFADVIRAEADRQLLDVRVLQRDVFSTTEDLRRDYSLILLSEVVSDFRSGYQLRALFELAAGCLAPGGQLVFNAFLARDGYTPDAAAVELGQQLYTSIFTRDQLAAAAVGMPLTLISDDSVYDYEKAHLPEGCWPPTSWYAGWVSGQDVFDVERDQSPVEMRWLVYQKTDTGPAAAGQPPQHQVFTISVTPP